jgi:hypothetical protein
VATCKPTEISPIRRLFVGPDLAHTFESITARINAELSVHSLLFSAKTVSEVAAAWDQIKQIAETTPVPPTPAPGIATGGRRVLDPYFSPRQFAIQLLAVRDRMGERAAVELAASSRAYPRIHKE